MTATEGMATDGKNKLAFFSKHQIEMHETMNLLSKTVTKNIIYLKWKVSLKSNYYNWNNFRILCALFQSELEVWSFHCISI